MAELNQEVLREITVLRQKTIEMLEKAWSMFRTIFEGLMKNDIDILNKALKGESEITQMFNDLTTF
ncbi:MAG: hypothetical protein ABIA97_02465, partial [Candidatus Omnitrophota bacterium]